MTTKIIPYLITEDRGCITSRRRNVIRVGETAPGECAFESLSELGKHITKRKVKLIEELQVVVDGEVDEAATEKAIESNYANYYANLEAIAIDWIVGMTLVHNQPEPVRHNGKIYEVEQTHTVVDPNHTPEVVPALYTEIPSPTPGLDCVEWYVPTSTKNYSKGECMAYTDGYYYESSIDNNIWSPEAYPAGWEPIGPI